MSPSPSASRPAKSAAHRAWLFAFTLLAAGAALGCDDDDDAGPCRNGECICSEGSNCEIWCDAPPCHVLCEGNNDACDAECANGDCVCGSDSHCDFACAAPPCHVQCDEHTSCTGECANGTCLCESGSTCDFECDTGPCHVECEGDTECSGTCRNNSCVCGPGSTCSFSCGDHNCTTECGPGASCLLECPEGAPNTQGCNFDSCDGTPIVCPDGKTVACNAECPQTDDED